MVEQRQGNFIAVTSDKPQIGNWHTAVYEDDYKGLLIALCNQNGRYPHQAIAILDGLNGKKASADLLTEKQAEIASLQERIRELEGAVSDESVVWSHEHSAWWRANSCGYARRIEDAGVYSRKEALEISHKGRDGWRPGEVPDELPVRVSDLPEFARAALKGAKP